MMFLINIYMYLRALFVQEEWMGFKPLNIYPLLNARNFVNEQLMEGIQIPCQLYIRPHQNGHQRASVYIYKSIHQLYITYIYIIAIEMQ